MNDNELRIYLPYVHIDLLPKLKEINPASEYVLQTDPTLDVSLNYKFINKQMQNLTDEAKLYENNKTAPRFLEIGRQLQDYEKQMKEIKKTEFYKNKIAKSKKEAKETKNLKKELRK